jgi:hypothetical protein
MYVTFYCAGRFGNNLFQYLMSKLFTIKFGHTYIPENEFIKLNLMNGEHLVITDTTAEIILNSDEPKNKHIYCRGDFQKSDIYMNFRDLLKQIVYDIDNNDYWERNGEKIFVKQYLNGTHSLNLNPTDVIMCLRLDDFIQYPCKTSDIIPPQYYIEILENMKLKNEKLYILCDRINRDWEHNYIKHFKKWNAELIQNTLIHDIAVMRDCNVIIHSNSTLNWIISFLSNKTKRFIPKTHFYGSQILKKIDETDILTSVQPLNHDEVHNLNAEDTKIIPLSYSIPDECVVESIPDKEYLLAPLIPGNISTYIYGKNDESLYYDMYKKSRFAITMKKGGWDCLRHYEILMNGCIPLFENLKDCPDNTLTTYPKHLNDEAYELYNNWKDNEDYIEKYNMLCLKFLEHTRLFCTCSSSAKKVLHNMKDGDIIKNVLMITCNSGLNYSRELLWIGIKRHVQSMGGVAVEYPKINVLYKDYDINSSDNTAFTYSRRLDNEDTIINEEEIIEKINNHFWDLIIYGKVGPDDYCDFPLYNIVKTKYNKNKIAFIFGGDEPYNLKIIDKDSHHFNFFNKWIPSWPYVDYLNYYKQFGKCFVRELDM